MEICASLWHFLCYTAGTISVELILCPAFMDGKGKERAFRVGMHSAI